MSEERVSVEVIQEQDIPGYGALKVGQVLGMSPEDAKLLEGRKIVKLVKDVKEPAPAKTEKRTSKVAAE